MQTYHLEVKSSKKEPGISFLWTCYPEC
jgi:hypothetical protein